MQLPRCKCQTCPIQTLPRIIKFSLVEVPRKPSVSGSSSCGVPQKFPLVEVPRKPSVCGSSSCGVALAEVIPRRSSPETLRMWKFLVRILSRAEVLVEVPRKPSMSGSSSCGFSLEVLPRGSSPETLRMWKFFVRIFSRRSSPSWKFPGNPP